MTKLLLSKVEAFVFFTAIAILIALGGALFFSKSAHAQSVVATPCGPLVTDGYALDRASWDYAVATNPACARFQWEAQEAINAYGIAGLLGTVKRWNGGQIIVTPVLPPPPVVVYKPWPWPTISGVIILGSRRGHGHGHQNGRRHRH